MKYYKVLKNDLKSPYADFDYSKWVKNKKWLPKIDKKEHIMCRVGYHITPYWNMWYDDGYRVFEVEAKGIKKEKTVGVEDKFTCETFRFLKEIKIK